MQSTWTTHKGKKVFKAAFDHKGLDAISVEMDEVLEELKKQPPKSVLYMSDTRGVIITPNILHKLQDNGKLANPYISRMAILGITGSVKRAMFDAVLKFIGVAVPTQTFEDESEALDWLVN